MELDGTEVTQARDCRSFSASCHPFHGPSCEPEAVLRTSACAPTNDLVVLAPGVSQVPDLVVHELVHVAAGRVRLDVGPGDPRGTDSFHRDARLWAPAPGAVETMALAEVARGLQQ